MNVHVCVELYVDIICIYVYDMHVIVYLSLGVKIDRSSSAYSCFCSCTYRIWRSHPGPKALGLLNPEALTQEKYEGPYSVGVDGTKPTRTEGADVVKGIMRRRLGSLFCPGHACGCRNMSHSQYTLSARMIWGFCRTVGAP